MTKQMLNNGTLNNGTLNNGTFNDDTTKDGVFELCVGCPYRSAFYVIQEVFGKNAIFISDIDCSLLGVRIDRAGAVNCTGTSIHMAADMADSGETKPICCTVSDLAFLNTELDSLAAAVSNGANITVAVLDSGIAAMANPHLISNINQTAAGEAPPDISLEAICASLGAPLIKTADAFDYSALKTAFRDAKVFSGVSVVIVQQFCSIAKNASAAELSLFEVVPDKCKGCRRCMLLGCQAIEFDKNKAVAFINDGCTGCGFCAQICGFDAIAEAE